MRIRTLFVFAVALMMASCRGDGDWGDELDWGEGDGGDDDDGDGDGDDGECQACADEYCVCITESSAPAGCVDEASQCTAEHCSDDQMNDLSFDECTVEPEACQDCIDDICDCIGDTTDQDLIDTCMAGYSVCEEFVCSGVSESQIDDSCLP